MEWRFLTNNNLTSFSLVSSRKNTMFAFKAEALCPTSRTWSHDGSVGAFIIKSVSNDLQAQERVQIRKEGVLRGVAGRVALQQDVRRIPPMAVRRRSASREHVGF